jgi:hypothetical protein
MIGVEADREPKKLMRGVKLVDTVASARRRNQARHPGRSIAQQQN